MIAIHSSQGEKEKTTYDFHPADRMKVKPSSPQSSRVGIHTESTDGTTISSYLAVRGTWHQYRPSHTETLYTSSPHHPADTR